MIEIIKIIDSKTEIEFVDEVSKLAEEAQNYLKSHKWCDKIIQGWLAEEWGYILSIFYFELKPTQSSNADNYVWIIVGDLPPAYIDIQSASNSFEALNAYVLIMEEWINNIKQGKSVDDCFPINVEPSIKYADMLSSRINIIKSDFLPSLRQRGECCS